MMTPDAPSGAQSAGPTPGRIDLHLRIRVKPGAREQFLRVDVPGRRAARLLMALVAIVGVKSVIVEIAHVAGDYGELVHVVQGLAAILVGGLLFILCGRRLWTEAEAEQKEKAGDDKGEAGRSSPWPVRSSRSRSIRPPRRARAHR